MRARRLKSLTMSAAAVAMVAQAPAQAWGPQGHTIIWKVAQTRLSPAVLARIHDIETADGADITVSYPETDARTHRTTTRVCGTDNDQTLSNWADCVRYSPDVTYNHTADYHFDDMPWCGDIPSKPRYCIDGACGSTQLESYLNTLRNSHDARARFEALAYVIHFVGDLHQPLHTITNGLPHNSDNGGNGILISVDTDYIRHSPVGYNLHKLWDGGILSVTPGLPDAQGRPQSLEQSVRQLAAQNAAAWRHMTGRRWRN
ncbi:MAG: nuclease [Sphingomonadales bacterium]|jgi:transposase|nr:nuclease [Sphingomonadales bacterium]